MTRPFQKRCSSATLASSQSHQVPFLPTRSRDHRRRRPSSLIRGNLFDVAGTPVRQCEVARPLVLTGHPPTMEVVVGHVDMRGLVHPVLEDLAGLVASGIRVRGCGPSRANSGNSWLRTNTLTESIWIRPDPVEHARGNDAGRHVPSDEDRRTPGQPVRSGAQPQARPSRRPPAGSVGDGDGDRVDHDVGARSIIAIGRRPAAWRRRSRGP